jgi:predicted metal-dependent HD superfamily phosphohydrolase
MIPEYEGWNLLWRRIDARGDADQVLKQLTDLYSETHRAYHNLQHLHVVLAEFKQAQLLCVNPDAVEMSIWFHDAIYDTHAKDNEEKSAALCAGILRAASLMEDFNDRVTALILATKHTSSPSDPDAAVLVDADLSILGRPEPEFDQYERNIRAEYSWVSDEAFRTGRTAVLRSFLDRPRIFTTDHFHHLYEATARKNLSRSIAALKS